MGGKGSVHSGDIILTYVTCFCSMSLSECLTLHSGANYTFGKMQFTLVYGDTVMPGCVGIYRYSQLTFLKMSLTAAFFVVARLVPEVHL